MRSFTSSPERSAVVAGRPARSLWRARSRELLACAEAAVLLALLLNILSLGTGLVTAWAAVGVVLVLVVTLRVMHVDGDLKTLSTRRKGQAPQRAGAARPAAQRRPATGA
jgi:hypothetical protein